MPRAKAMKTCKHCGELKAKNEDFGGKHRGKKDICYTCEAEIKSARIDKPILTRWVCGPYAKN